MAFIAALMIAAAPVPAQPRTCTALEVRAMSYNIRLDLASDGANAWPHRRNELIGQIEIVRPDIVGLQEVLSNQRRDMALALPGYEFLGVGRDDGRDGGEYSSLGISKSAFSALKSGTFWLSPTPDRPSLGWDASYKRIATWARLKHRRSGALILALNTHWDHQGLVARRESGAQIANWILRNRRRGERLVILGDFNAPMSEPSMTLLMAGGVEDARQRARRILGGKTTFNNFQAIPTANADPIDHILIDRAWTVRRYATISQHVGGRVASDHFPVVADLSLDSRKNCP